jgi:hypothetical protein
MIGETEWHEALAEQLTNLPSDLRIEQWIYGRFPGLRKIQERSLTEEVHRGYESLELLVAPCIPASIYQPTTVMNAAQAYHVAELFHQPELLEPFAAHGLAGVGEHLAREVLDAPDLGHRSDMQATNRWASEFGLTGWFEWQPFEGSR